ncbi:hypothetical protein JCM24511_09399 [Saitozyma sp. JCM 24511]|nr:hypothetical protein JCM24511_09399 [Saitozyma sp. JCM 24511]
MLVLNGSPMSTCTGRVLACFFQMGLELDKDFKLAPLEDYADIYKPEWLANQPFGQMPFLIDEEQEYVIFESRAIIKYVAAKIGSPLLPKQADLKAYGNFEQACSIEHCNFDEPAHSIAGELYFAKFHGREGDVALADKNKALLAKRLKVYDQILSKQKYIAGDDLTLVDLFHLTYGNLNVTIGGAPALTDAEGHPNLVRWWKEVTSLPGWVKYQELLPKN